jgi:hypothetical protein
MSIAQAQQFYGFLEGVFETKLAGIVQKNIKERLSSAFSFPISDHEFKVWVCV